MMPPIRPRRIVRRAVMATGVVVLLVLSYVAGAPLICYFLAQRFPATMPMLEVVYAPMVYYFEHEELPGGEMYRDYVHWCQQCVDRALN